MKIGRKSVAALALSFGLLGALACGGSTETASDEDPREIVEAQNRAAQSESTDSEPSMCDLMTAAEIDAALGGKLPLASPQSFDGGCQFPIQFGVDGNALSFQTISRGNYDAYKGYEDSNVPFEFIEGLGQEAFVINNAQVCVLLSEDKALFVGAQVMSVQEELPITQEELKAGLIEIATKLAPKV